MITDTRVPCWLVGLVVLCWTPAARAIDDPSFDFKTLTTPHFYVHYEQRLRPLARRSARLAEQAHADLAPLLGHRPEKRTHVVLDDRVDLANGSANVFGRNVVKLYATPPAPDGVLGYYNDWLKVLIYHEYVHILHLDTRGEVLPWTDYLLGKQFHPNAVLPGWYVEGLAVLEESRLTGTGRNNSALFQMWLRTAALSDRFFSLGTATGLPEAWPQGTAPYLYGGAFTDYIADTHGQSFFRTFNHRYGRRIIPFALNKTAEDISGKTFHRLWKEWTAAEYGRAVARTIRVEAEGGTELEYLTEGGNLHRYPRMRPGTRQVSFYKSDLETNERFAVVEHGDTRVRTLHPAEGVTGSADWTPDGETLVYGRQTVYGSTYTYQDLYAWHAESDSVVRMTRKERARDPAVSPDGDRLAYVRNRRGTMDLVVCARTGTELNDCRAVAGGAVTDPGTRRHWQQISGPTWAPDGGAVVFSRWQLDTGRRDLWRWNRKSGELQQLTDDRAQQLDPTFGPDGSLYYASDRTGIFNIYRRRRPTGESHRVSNVVRGVFHPRVSPNGEWIYVSAYTDDGYELARFEHPVSGADARSTTANTEKQPAPPDVS
ncbi:MAG: TolB family protein, partial [Bradymonadaceae bacterium]